MALGVSDDLLPVIVPIAVYWIGSGIFSMMRGWMEKHRLFSDEEDAMNLVTRRQAVLGVLVNQALQMGLVAIVFLRRGGAEVGDDNAGATLRSTSPPSLLRLTGQLVVAVMVMDAWTYFLHRLLHANKFLYKHIHCVHHRLVAPYVYGAQYIHPLDSFICDTVGGTLSTLVAGMSPQTSTIFFTIITLKSLENHSGLWFPQNPLSRLLTNNSAVHAFHHQHAGIKSNYCNYFFATWDKLLGTFTPCSVVEREGGGYQLRAAGKDH